MENNQEIQTTNIDKVIEETQNDIKLNEESKNKKRGRPSKKDQKDQPQKILSQPTSNEQKMSVDVYKQMLTGVITLSSVYLNKASESEIFTLSKEEMELVTQSGADCLMEFVPSVNSKYMKLAGFGLVLASVYGVRYYQFEEVLKQKKKLREVKNETETNG